MSKFDPDKPLVMAKPQTIYIHRMATGDPLTIVDEETPDERGAVTADLAERLWATGFAVYADDFRPTPVESPEEHARRVVILEPLSNGYYVITAPWLPKSLKVRGQAKAEAAHAALIEAGPQPIPEPVIEEPVEEPVAPPPPPPPPEDADPTKVPETVPNGTAEAVVETEHADSTAAPAGSGEVAEG